MPRFLVESRTPHPRLATTISPCGRRLRRDRGLVPEKLDFELDQEWPFGDMRLAYMHNGSAKIEILGGSTAEPQEQVDP